MAPTKRKPKTNKNGPIVVTELVEDDNTRILRGGAGAPGQHAGITNTNSSTPISTHEATLAAIRAIEKLEKKNQRQGTQLAQIIAFVKNQPKLRPKEAANYKLIEERQTRMEKSVKAVIEQLAELIKRIDRLETGSSHHVPPPLINTTAITTDATSATSIKIESSNHQNPPQNTLPVSRVSPSPRLQSKIAATVNVPTTEAAPIVQAGPFSAPPPNTGNNFNSKVCPKCGEAFARSNLMIRHLRHVHCNLPEVRFQCEFCAKSYSQRPRLTYHQKKVHGRISKELEHVIPTPCPEDCGQAFTRNFDLIQHMQACRGRGQMMDEPAKPNSKEPLHDDTDPEDIDKDSDYQETQDETNEMEVNMNPFVLDLLEHEPNTEEEGLFLTTETTRNPLRCQYCPSSSTLIFEDIKSLANHYMNNHPIPPVGLNRTVLLGTEEEQLLPGRGKQICMTGNTRQENLRTHKRMHTAEQFQCLDCDRSFSNLSQLNTHAISHTDERSHKCNYCNKTFKYFGSLRTHMYKHTGKRHVCKDCGHHFATRYRLKIHQQQHHARATGTVRRGNVVQESSWTSTIGGGLSINATCPGPPEPEEEMLVDSGHLRDRYPKIEIIETSLTGAD